MHFLNPRHWPKTPCPHADRRDCWPQGNCLPLRGSGRQVQEESIRTSVSRPGYRCKNANLHTTFEKIIRRAGVRPWPKIWHNLRASRQTELCLEHPEHVVCCWMGNSKAVARENYLQVTDADIQRAVQGRGGSGSSGFIGAAQNPAQQAAAGACKGQHAETAISEKTLNLHANADV